VCVAVGVAVTSLLAAGNDIATSEAGPSLAIGCNSDALLGWNRGANGLFVATNPTGAAQCTGPDPGPSPGPGAEEPTTPGGNLTTPGGSTPGGSAQGGGTGTGSSAGSSTPPTTAKKPLKCKKKR
jgi:hypothetical protein